jgi:hypothetical protein
MRCDQKVSELYFSFSYNLHLHSVPYCALQSSFLASWYSVTILLEAFVDMSVFGTVQV